MSKARLMRMVAQFTCLLVALMAMPEGSAAVLRSAPYDDKIIERYEIVDATGMSSTRISYFADPQTGVVTATASVEGSAPTGASIGGVGVGEAMGAAVSSLTINTPSGSGGTVKVNFTQATTSQSAQHGLQLPGSNLFNGGYAYGRVMLRVWCNSFNTTAVANPKAYPSGDIQLSITGIPCLTKVQAGVEVYAHVKGSKFASSTTSAKVASIEIS